jgi:hypothetical protein
MQNPFTKSFHADSMPNHNKKMTGMVEPEEFLLHARVMMRRHSDRSGGGSAVEVESIRFRAMLEYARKSVLICGT